MASFRKFEAGFISFPASIFQAVGISRHPLLFVTVVEVAGLLYKSSPLDYSLS